MAELELEEEEEEEELEDDTEDAPYYIDGDKIIFPLKDGIERPEEEPLMVDEMDEDDDEDDSDGDDEEDL